MSKKDEPKPADVLLEKILAGSAVLFHDQYNDTYIAYDGNGSDVSKVGSSKSKLWVARYGYKHFKKSITQTVVNQVIQMLEANALFDGDELPLEVRTVRSNTSGLWYDLGGSAVHVTRDGWAINEQPPIIFKRFGHQKAQTIPLRGGDIRSLLKYINLTSTTDQLLFLVYVVSAFIPDFPHPLLILHGVQGAGKSTPMAIMKDLIDPSSLGDGFSTPKDVFDFGQTASHHQFLYYDNLSKMEGWFSDALARAATGSSFSKRQLYTDDDDIIYSIQKTIALNGINQIVSRSDLLDRSILIHMERISPALRRDKVSFWNDFNADKPQILGAVFDILVEARKLYPTVVLAELPRMADFARWGYAIAEAAGFSGDEFLTAYNGNIEVQHDEAIQANPVAQVIVELMKTHDEWFGTPTELYTVLDDIAIALQLNRSYGWPKDAAWLIKRLHLLIPNLIAKGIEITEARGDERTLTIRKTTDTTDGNDSKKG
jgi:hypothetical protein